MRLILRTLVYGAGPQGRGWIAAEWKKSDKGKRARYYRLTPDGRERLTVQQSRGEALSMSMARVLRPAE